MSLHLHPCFKIPPPNEAIELVTEQARIRIGKESLEGLLTTYVTLIPRPQISWKLEIPPYFGLDFNQTAEATLLSTGTIVRCRLLRGKLFTREASTVWLRPLQEINSGDLDAAVSKVIFVIPNFPEFLAHPVMRDFPDGGFCREDEIRLQFSDWSVTIDSTADVEERKNILADQGGFAITAVGVFERIDQQPFIWNDVAPHIEALRIFLSFVCGRWTGPMLPAGVDSTGEPVWFRFDVPLVDEGISVFTWFDTHHGKELSDIVPGFMATWSDSVLKEAFSYAIYWFVRANSAAAGADGSLILSQAALETLSWMHLVKISGMTKSKYKSFKAEELIRQLLTAMKIPLAVPAALGALQVLAGTRTIKDGVSAIVAVRNSLAHAEKQPAVLPVTEAWALA